MVYFSILLFFVYTFCLGFTVSSFVKNSDNFIERNLMRIGYGMSMLPFLAIVLNLIKVPADWRILLALSLIYPIYFIVRNLSKFNISQYLQLKVTKTNISIFIMLLIFAATFYIYASGAFKYPYLEDDDSWGHAEGVKYISIEKNVFAESTKYVRYINPYPPTYDLLLGILHQTNDSVYWTLKFFNALIVSLSIIFFYFFAKEFSGSRNNALFATFALASIPAFMSHFIWALALSVPLYFVCFYAVEMVKYDRKWWIVAGLIMVTILTSSPTHSTYFGLFFVLYLLTKIALERKFLLWHTAAGILGLGLSFLVWWLPMILRHGVEKTIQGLGFRIGFIKEYGLGTALRGTGDRVYTFSDFFIAQKQNMINNPIGIGIFLSVLTIIAVIFLLIMFKELIKKENHWLAITFVWFVFALYAVNAAKFTIKLSPFRAWMLLAIPVCILAAQGAIYLMGTSGKTLGKFGKYGILLFLLIGIYFTSTQQKIAVNTAVWPPGGFWTSNEEIAAYLWIRENLKPDTKVFGFVIDGPIIGNDKFICYWCEDIIDFRKDAINKTASEISTFLKSRGYEYIIIDGQVVKEYGAEKANAKLQEFADSGLFSPAYQNQGAIIFKI